MIMSEDGGTVYQVLLFPSKRKGACTEWLLFYCVGLGPASLAMADRDVP